MRRSSSLLFTLLIPTLALACNDDAPAVDEEGTGVTLGNDAGTSSAESGSSTGDGDGDPGDGDGDPCAIPCGDGCCNEGELCELDTGSCVLDCGGDPVCGNDPGQCCGDAEVCFAGGCIVPGDACQPSSCATDTESPCGIGEVCDPDLGACVPDLADPSCTFAPEPGVFDPVPRFSWGTRKPRACVDASDCQTEEICDMGMCAVTWPHINPAPDDAPTKVQSVGTPVVGDLDGDCIPEIVFNSFAPPDYLANGALRAIRGDTGAKLWTVDDPAWHTDSAASPAIGDLDYDGVPEVVTPGEGQYLLAFAADGTPLWKSDDYTGAAKSGGASIANFDGQGNAEIAYGRAVYDSNGQLLWQGTGAQGINGSSVGKLSCVADIDNDFRPELIAGGTAYDFTGTVGVDFVGSVMWANVDHAADGYCGLGDLDVDGLPEVVIVRAGWIDVLDAIDGVTLASVQIPGGGAGGPPNIADFDGDGLPDIGLAGGDFYVVVQFDGLNTLTELWRADTKDGSSSRTGSSVFDFDGDGRSEVIYFDEHYLRIYPGVEPDCALMAPGPACDGIMTDAEILFIDINSSQTRSEYPVVADVDGDFKAEIVVTTNNWSNQGNIGDAGVEVFEDRLDNWVATLPIWNQHSYHVTNVDAKGGIPVIEEANWLSPIGDPENSYRRNSQGSVENCAPDLVPQDLEQLGPCQPDLNLSVRVCNQGCLGVGPGVEVSFFDQDAGLLGVVTTDGAIIAGTCEKVELTVPAPHENPFTVMVTVDDDGMGAGGLNECIEDNNGTGPVDLCPNIG